MKTIINTITLRYPLTPGQVVQEVGGGITMPSNTYMPDGYAWVEPSLQPEHDPETHKVEELQPVLDDGVFLQQWCVIPLSPEEIETIRRSRIPISCSPAQGLIALFALKGITEQDILDAINLIPDPVERYAAQIGYNRATTWERESPTMQAMARLLELTEQDLDELFAYAVGVMV